MKNLFLFIPALICGGMMFCLSCSEEKIDDSALSMSIYTVSQSTTKSAAIHASEHEDGLLWCTGNDIEWYNATTGELKLKNIQTKVPPFLNISKLTIFLNEIELFSIEQHWPASSYKPSKPSIDFVDPDDKWIYIGCKCGKEYDHIPGPDCESIKKYVGNGGRYIISINYPEWTPEYQKYLDEMAQILGQDWVDNLVKEREAFEAGWSIFIEQLKKEGRYRE